jgi:DNA-binding transcriptional LysR family regulator
MALDLRDLEFFLAVVREGSFGRAASELIVTQPAVSDRIRHLERVVGTEVFERTARGAVLTPAGEQLLPYAERCTALATQAVEVIQEGEHFPRFVVAVHSTFAPNVVPMVLGALASLPRRVEVRDAHSHEVETLVLDGVADVGFVVPSPARRGLRRVPLATDPVHSFVAPGHDLARKRRPDLGDLATTLIAVNAWGDGADAFLDRLRARGIADWRIRRCGDTATAVALARDHEHVAFVSDSSAAAAVRAGQLGRVAFGGWPRWNVRLDLVYRTGDRADEVVQKIRRAMA